MNAKRSDPSRVGVLVVGTGFLGGLRAMAANASRSTRLAAIFDPNARAASSIADRLSVPAVASLREGLNLPEVEAVVVATPHSEHDDAVRRSLEDGKHVLCEKPLSIDPDEARDLAALADDRGLRLATGFNHRFYPPVRDALSLVSSWKIGRIESVRLTIGHAASPEFLAGWHADRTVSGGGTLMDNGVHACDLARLFLGEIAAAKGYTRDAIGLPLGVESEAFALFRNHDRGVAEVRSSWTLEAGYLTIEVRGSRGFLKVETAPWRLSGRLGDGSRLDRRYLGERASEIVFRRLHGCERSLVRELDQFASDTTFGGGATGWDGVRASEMVQAVYRSAATASEVELSTPFLRDEAFPSEQAVARQG